MQTKPAMARLARSSLLVSECSTDAGRNLEAGDKDNHYFQDFDSYNEGSRYDSSRNGTEPVFHHGDAIKHMFEYEKALDTLLSCSLRRNAKGL